MSALMFEMVEDDTIMHERGASRVMSKAVLPDGLPAREAVTS
jgi:hypothetical protein